jgi:hypothetical protein
VNAQEMVSFLTAMGIPAVLLALITGLVKWISGASARERVKNTDLATQRKHAIIERNEAIDERDEADRKRRIIYEYASILRSKLLELGFIPDPWPDTDKKSVGVKE